MANFRNKIQLCIHGSETRSGEDRVPECAWDVPLTLVETQFPAGVGGDSWAGTMCRSMSGERALHPDAARGYYGSRLDTRGHRRYQVPVLLSDSFRNREDFMRCCEIVEAHLLKMSFCDQRGRGLLRATRSGSLERALQATVSSFVGSVPCP
jgi:hypothetical protein